MGDLGRACPRGCPPIQLSERGRQCAAFALILLSLVLCQVGLVLLGLSFYVWPYLQRHALVVGTHANAELFPYGLIAASAATITSSCLAVMAGVSARQKRKSGKRAAVIFGYFYLAAELVTVLYLTVLIALFGGQVDAFESAYQAGFTRLMWDYLKDRRTKEYIDGVQQDFACCGSQGYSDWFVVDWYPEDLYLKRYKEAAKRRTAFAKKAFSASGEGKASSSALMQSFVIENGYGTEKHKNLVAKAMDWEYYHDDFNSDLKFVKLNAPFSEVPFSCCDPASPTWCHQRYPNYPWYNYSPAKQLGIYHVGCVYKVKAFLNSTVQMLISVLALSMLMKWALMLFYRVIQTSMSNALAAGRHLSPALGYVMPLPPKAAASAPSDDPEKQALLAGSDGQASDTTAETSTEATGDTSTEATGDTSTEATADTSTEGTGITDSEGTADTSTEMTENTDTSAEAPTLSEVSEDESAPPPPSSEDD